MQHIFEPGISFREVLELLKKYLYALIKVNVLFMPERFPDKIPSGKDIDILCAKEDFEALSGRLSNFIDQQADFDIVKRKFSD